MKPNTQYGLRVPEDAEIIDAFGSLAACLRVTGGDMPTILFYLNNRDRIAAAAPLEAQYSAFSEDFRSRVAAEVYDAMEKPTITAVAGELGVCKQLARRALVATGRRAA